MENFFGNSPEIQVAFIAGYLSYRLASAGLDRSHKAVDVIFQTLTYGLITHVLYVVLININSDWRGRVESEYLIVAVSAAVTLLIALFWRAKGRDKIISFFQNRNLIRENFAPSTWDSIIYSSHKWAYVSVTCSDGKTYESDISNLPGGLPFGTLDTDQHGNIAIYVTRTIDADGQTADYGPEDVHDKYGRANITYLPASEIKRIDVSFRD